ncbi:hypothetical protein [Nocardioides sp.]|uniref:hypothetical protein n=1 Tax=Nocardioides sp. TaxID=35761 RepID=UPI00286BD097|nr:hypothetical protein [Nocardioides sp.]
MKRIALIVATVAALASLTACSGSDDEPTAATESTESADTPTEEPTDEPTDEPTETAADDRFAAALTQVSDLFTVLNTQDDVEPTTTEEANAAAGLDDTTPLVFVDYSTLEDGSGGSLCLLSDTGTYVAVSFADGEGEVDLGEGDCSYDPADATVVGDLASDTWTVGAELMGDLLPTAVFGG